MTCRTGLFRVSQGADPDRPLQRMAHPGAASGGPEVRPYGNLTGVVHPMVTRHTYMPHPGKPGTRSVDQLSCVNPDLEGFSSLISGPLQDVATPTASSL